MTAPSGRVAGATGLGSSVFRGYVLMPDSHRVAFHVSCHAFQVRNHLHAIGLRWGQWVLVDQKGHSPKLISIMPSLNALSCRLFDIELFKYGMVACVSVSQTVDQQRSVAILLNGFLPFLLLSSTVFFMCHGISSPSNGGAQAKPSAGGSWRSWWLCADWTTR